MSSDGREWLALLRRHYLHVIAGGQLTERDMARHVKNAELLVDKLEELSQCAQHRQVRIDINTNQAWCESCKHGMDDRAVTRKVKAMTEREIVSEKVKVIVDDNWPRKATTWETSDGQVFRSPEKARIHQEEIRDEAVRKERAKKVSSWMLSRLVNDHRVSSKVVGKLRDPISKIALDIAGMRIEEVKEWLVPEPEKELSNLTEAEAEESKPDA